MKKGDIVLIPFPFTDLTGNHGYETPKQALETNSAAELRGIIPSDFIGIVRLTNFSSLTPEI